VVDERTTLDRRTFLASVVATAVAAGTGAGALAGCSSDNDSDARDQPTTTLPPIPDDLPDDVFTLGVASGDPLPRSVILWTRLVADLTADDGGVGTAPLPVRWEVASDEDFVDLVVDGTAIADPALAHSVHVEADHLQPDNVYWYRFRMGDRTSPVGRTRTTPADDADSAELRFAFASCQNYQDGYWTAYEHMADEDLDLVLFLGDYIYEGGPDPNAVRTYRTEAPTDLAGYRRRWAEYKSDPALQGVHQQFPWVVTWDDHEVDNDYAGDIAEDPGAGAPAARQQFRTRRAAAYQAFYEHQPVRLDPPSGADYRIYRSFSWGRLAAFYVLDGRQYRSKQECLDQAILGKAGPLCDAARADDRTMLGPEQEAWLGDSLTDSRARWNVLAQQTVVSRVPFAGEGAGAIVNLDQWDGYPAARQRLVKQLRTVSNPVVITGDIHLGGLGVITDDPDDPTSPPVATEIVGTSISSSFPVDVAGLVETGATALPNVRYINARQRGYAMCTVDRDQLQAEFKVVRTVERPDSSIDTDAVWIVDDGDPDPHEP
jgi:alkaline phosphatase D